jgi:hypothetical protein
LRNSAKEKKISMISENPLIAIEPLFTQGLNKPMRRKALFNV